MYVEFWAARCCVAVKEVMEEREVGHCQETQVTDHRLELSKTSKDIVIETEMEKVGGRDSQAKETLRKDDTEDTVIHLTQEVDLVQGHPTLLSLEVLTYSYNQDIIKLYSLTISINISYNNFLFILTFVELT